MFDFYYICSSHAKANAKVRKIQTLLVALGLLLLAPVQNVLAQDDDPLAGSAYSPYSLFGFGDMLRLGTSYNQSMGGIGIADRNVRYINILNPAAVTAREQKSFMMDFGLENRNTLYQSGTARSANNTFNMHHIVATFPIATHSAFKVGLMPISSVAYDFQSKENSDALLSEVGDIKYERTGRGGIYQAFLGAGVTLWHRLSLGAEAQYYFGKINRSSNADFLSSASYRTLLTGWDYNISCFGGKVGLQYTQPLTNALSAVVGVTYDIATPLRGHETRYAIGEGSSKNRSRTTASPPNWAPASRCATPTSGWSVSTTRARTGEASTSAAIRASISRQVSRRTSAPAWNSPPTATMSAAASAISCAVSPTGAVPTGKDPT